MPSAVGPHCALQVEPGWSSTYSCTVSPSVHVAHERRLFSCYSALITGFLLNRYWFRPRISTWNVYLLWTVRTDRGASGSRVFKIDFQSKAEVLVHAMKESGEGVEVWLHAFLTSALDGGEWSAFRPGRFIPGERTPVPINRRLGGPQWLCGSFRAEEKHLP